MRKDQSNQKVGRLVRPQRIQEGGAQKSQEQSPEWSKRKRSNKKKTDKRTDSTTPTVPKTNKVRTKVSGTSTFARRMA